MNVIKIFLGKGLSKMPKIPAWSRDNEMVERAFDIIQTDGEITKIDLVFHLKMGIRQAERVHSGLKARYAESMNYKKGKYIYNYAIKQTAQKTLEVENSRSKIIRKMEYRNEQEH